MASISRKSIKRWFDKGFFSPSSRAKLTDIFLLNSYQIRCQVSIKYVGVQMKVTKCIIDSAAITIMISNEHLEVLIYLPIAYLEWTRFWNFQDEKTIKVKVTGCLNSLFACFKLLIWILNFVSTNWTFWGLK